MLEARRNTTMPEKLMPIRKYMTPSPHTLGVEQTLAVASQVMRRHGVRHLPVLRAGTLVGVVSDRDLAALESLRDVDPARVTVEDAMTQSPYAVPPETPLSE